MGQGDEGERAKGGWDSLPKASCFEFKDFNQGWTVAAWMPGQLSLAASSRIKAAIVDASEGFARTLSLSSGIWGEGEPWVRLARRESMGVLRLEPAEPEVLRAQAGADMETARDILAAATSHELETGPWFFQSASWDSPGQAAAASFRAEKAAGLAMMALEEGKALRSESKERGSIVGKPRRRGL